MRIAISVLVAGLWLTSSMALAQSVATPPAVDDATLRADVSDLRTRLFALVDRFDHAHAGRDTIEAAMGISFPGETDPSKQSDRRMAGDLFLKGFHHLSFNEYFNPSPREVFPGGRVVIVNATYTGEFETIPFDQDPASCLSLHDFRDHLAVQGWGLGESRIYIKHLPNGASAITTRVDYTHNHVDLDLTVRGIPSGIPVPPAYASMPVDAKSNDCVVRIELSDDAS